jgi:kumamolisin
MCKRLPEQIVIAALVVLWTVLAANAAVAQTTSAAGTEVVLGLRWRNQAELDQFLHDVVDPESPQYQKYLSAGEFTARFAPSAEDQRAAVSYLEQCGYRVAEISTSGALILATRPVSAAARTGLDSAAAGDEIDALDPLPPDLADRVSVLSDDTATSLRSPAGSPLVPPQLGANLTPADIARIYAFTPLYEAGIRGVSGRQSTIAIATAFSFSTSDLQRFWSQFQIPRSLDSVELIPVGGDSDHVEAETTLDVQWSSALAPAAPILVYAGADASAVTFLEIYDQIVTENRAAVLTTSWSQCERSLPSWYLEQANAFFQRAAAQGITVVAASGDSGAYGCGSDDPGVTFPASSPYVLAVGGTSVKESPAGIVETAWQGSGGGWSDEWPAPPWQMEPGVHRGMADVALHADPAMPYMVAQDGTWKYYGGTSVGAPIWAALVALINQYRAQMGRDVLGMAAPLLCEAASSRDLPEKPFRDVLAGGNTAYEAGRGWDVPTGWGTPLADRLATALATWTPGDYARGGKTEVLQLNASVSGMNGAARLRFRRRCMTTAVTLRLWGVPTGSYTLTFDGRPVLSTAIGRTGRGGGQVMGADPRGRQIEVRDSSDNVVFSGSFDSVPEPMTVRVQLRGMGVVPGGNGIVLYRSARGREQLTVCASGLPAGEYQLRLGNVPVGTLISHGGATSAVARLKTGNGLPGKCLCQSLTVYRDSTPILRAPFLGPSAAACGF